MHCAEDGDGEGRIAIGKLRGEDYNFEFHGKVKEGKMHFRLYMTQVRSRMGSQAVWSQKCMWECKCLVQDLRAANV